MLMMLLLLSVMSNMTVSQKDTAAPACNMHGHAGASHPAETATRYL